MSMQYNICGNPSCRCKADPPIKHGPYPQVSFSWRGKSTTQFVREEDVDEVQKQLANYHQLRVLVDEWGSASPWSCPGYGFSSAVRRPTVRKRTPKRQKPNKNPEAVSEKILADDR